MKKYNSKHQKNKAVKSVKAKAKEKHKIKTESPRKRNKKINVKQEKIEVEKEENVFAVPNPAINLQTAFEVNSPPAPFVTLKNPTVQSNCNGSENGPYQPPVFQNGVLDFPSEISGSINVDNVNSTLEEISTELAKVSPRLNNIFMSPEQNGAQLINANNNEMDTS